LPKAKLHVHDQSRIHRQEVREALKEAIEKTNSHEIEGAFILLVQRDKSIPATFKAGILKNSDKALLHIARAKLKILVGHD